MPYIERMGGFIDPTNKKGKKGVPRYDSSDIFVLNLGGSPQELVPIGNGEYRLRIEGANYKIQYDSTNNYWQIWDKSGVKMRFGSSAASRMDRSSPYGTGTFRWCIDRVDDPKTNYMEYFYSQDMNGSYVNYLYLDHIQYNGQVSGNLAHNHQITFTLESGTRTDPIYNFKGGFKLFTQKRLSSIDIKTKINGNWVWVRRYQLAYEIHNNLNVRSRLHSVTLYGNDNTSSLPATTFTYQTLTAGFAAAQDWSNYSAWNAIDGNFIQNSTSQNGVYTDVIDMNGDGLPERVIYSSACYSNYHSGNCPWKISPNSLTEFGAQADWSNYSAWTFAWGNFLRNWDQYGLYTDVFDINGDGLPERVVFGRNYTWQYNFDNKWIVYPNNNGTGFGDLPRDSGGNAIPNWPNPSAWNFYSGNYIR
ncbi:MAG TPA: SpvB/TcaC N-terminal domain-containing protein, partial [Thermodesulfobacteriota bacterium]|nr:SpvB/TcaC N-terminal domain-containing protein [Thermodesulfobacteriota bacterium]